MLVAADLLYLRSTSEALGRRCAEALRAGCASIIVGDCGRPGRAAFLAALVASGVREESARFEAVDGWSAGTARHELISTSNAAPTATGRRLTPGDLIVDRIGRQCRTMDFGPTSMEKETFGRADGRRR